MTVGKASAEFSYDELLHYITTEDPADAETLFVRAREVRSAHYGRDVYFRGLIEFSNYCKNNCYSCGIRGGNRRVERYRLSPEEILGCCRLGEPLGYRTFVLQSGEDPWFTDDRIAERVEAVRGEFPDHAITLPSGNGAGKATSAFSAPGQTATSCGTRPPRRNTTGNSTPAG